MAKLRFTASKTDRQRGDKDKPPNKGVMSVEELLQRLEEFGVKDKPFAPAQDEVEGVLDRSHSLLVDGQHRRMKLAPNQGIKRSRDA
jgi:hypothetical protein